MLKPNNAMDFYLFTKKKKKSAMDLFNLSTQKNNNNSYI